MSQQKIKWIGLIIYWKRNIK